jgi:hypothetical protein
MAYDPLSDSFSGDVAPGPSPFRSQTDITNDARAQILSQQNSGMSTEDVTLVRDIATDLAGGTMDQRSKLEVEHLLNNAYRSSDNKIVAAETMINEVNNDLRQSGSKFRLEDQFNGTKCHVDLVDSSIVMSPMSDGTSTNSAFASQQRLFNNADQYLSNRTKGSLDYDIANTSDVTDTTQVTAPSLAGDIKSKGTIPTQSMDQILQFAYNAGSGSDSSRTVAMRKVVEDINRELSGSGYKLEERLPNQQSDAMKDFMKKHSDAYPLCLYKNDGSHESAVKEYAFIPKAPTESETPVEQVVDQLKTGLFTDPHSQHRWDDSQKMIALFHKVEISAVQKALKDSGSPFNVISTGMGNSEYIYVTKNGTPTTEFIVVPN